MRFYSFSNWMLSSIQQGIQPGHAAVELFVKYGRIPPNSSGAELTKFNMLYDWADDHKTFICLSGGDYKGVTVIAQFFDDVRNPYPFAAFYEDQDSLGGLMTSVGIIIPEKIYALAEQERNDRSSVLYLRQDGDFWTTSFINSAGDREDCTVSLWERDLIGVINMCGMAR